LAEARRALEAELAEDAAHPVRSQIEWDWVLEEEPKYQRVTVRLDGDRPDLLYEVTFPNFGEAYMHKHHNYDWYQRFGDAVIVDLDSWHMHIHALLPSKPSRDLPCWVVRLDSLDGDHLFDEEHVFYDADEARAFQTAVERFHGRPHMIETTDHVLRGRWEATKAQMREQGIFRPRHWF
jgi:hypothetical protein